MTTKTTTTCISGATRTAVAITETLVRVDVGLVEMKATTIVTCIVEMPTGVVIVSFMHTAILYLD